jgi:hypothetical protein
LGANDGAIGGDGEVGGAGGAAPRIHRWVAQRGFRQLRGHRQQIGKSAALSVLVFSATNPLPRAALVSKIRDVNFTASTPARRDQSQELPIMQKRIERYQHCYREFARLS